MADSPAHRRAAILTRTADLIGERAEDLARTIAAEAGTAIKFARAEVDRAFSCRPYTVAIAQSWLGREGIRFAMEEMTNIQMVAIRTGS